MLNLMSLAFLIAEISAFKKMKKGFLCICLTYGHDSQYLKQAAVTYDKQQSLCQI